MAKIGERIIDKAIEILRDSPEGVRYSELVRRIAASDASLKINTIHGNVWDLAEQYADRVYKPSRGLFRLTKYRDPDTDRSVGATERLGKSRVLPPRDVIVGTVLVEDPLDQVAIVVE